MCIFCTLRFLINQQSTFLRDVVISAGYRVKSPRTQFRIGANKILKEYLIKGYAFDQKKLQEQTLQLDDLNKMVQFFSNVAHRKTLNSNKAAGLFKVLTD